jgi:hypothetical protein
MRNKKKGQLITLMASPQARRMVDIRNPNKTQEHALNLKY